MTVALAFHDTIFDVVDRSGVPWLKAPEIARALGYSREDEISRLYRRHEDEFTDSMTQLIEISVEHQFGVEGRIRIFSPRGFHLLAMLARTRVAKAFRIFALDLIEKYETPRRQKALSFSPTEQAVLSRMPETAKHLTITQAASIARERPERLPDFLFTVLSLYLSTAEPSAIVAKTPEPPQVGAFWQTWAELVEAGHLANHSASRSLIAVNLPEFVRVARDQGFYAFDRRELCRLLPESRRHVLLNRNKTITSVTARKSVKCWIFRRLLDSV